MVRCQACQQPLTDEEVEYLAPLCERCERLAHLRLQAWRAGAHDPELDAGPYFQVPKRQ